MRSRMQRTFLSAATDCLFRLGPAGRRAWLIACKQRVIANSSAQGDGGMPLASQSAKKFGLRIHRVDVQLR